MFMLKLALDVELFSVPLELSFCSVRYDMPAPMAVV